MGIVHIKCFNTLRSHLLEGRECIVMKMHTHSRLCCDHLRRINRTSAKTRFFTEENAGEILRRNSCPRSGDHQLSDLMSIRVASKQRP